VQKRDLVVLLAQHKEQLPRQRNEISFFCVESDSIKATHNVCKSFLPIFFSFSSFLLKYFMEKQVMQNMQDRKL